MAPEISTTREVPGRGAEGGGALVATVLFLSKTKPVVKVGFDLTVNMRFLSGYALVSQLAS